MSFISSGLIKWHPWKIQDWRLGKTPDPVDVTSHPKGNAAKVAGIGVHGSLGFKSWDSVFGSFYLHVFFPVLIFVSHTGSIRPNNIRSHPVNRCRSEGRVRMWLGQHVEELFKFQEVRKYVLDWIVSELYLSKSGLPNSSHHRDCLIHVYQQDT